MTATDTTPQTWLFANGGGSTPQAVKDDAGKWHVKDLKVFKAGTVKDSRGRQKTWTPEELSAIVENFNALRQRELLVNVPVRADHSQSINAVQGYFEGMRTDGEFLYTDLEFTEPEGAEKFNRGTYRSRSIEIGAYETNGAQPETYAPVAMGLAFVDIGAVEGLFRSSTTGEPTMEVQTFKIAGVPTTDAAVVQATIDNYEAAKPVLHTFRVNGTDTTDFAAVQAQLDSLETFRTESMKAGRTDFVDGLVRDNKVLATQAEGLKTFAASLDDASFTAWKGTYADVPALFARAGDGNGSAAGAGSTTPEQDAITTAANVIRMHRMGGMDDDAVKKTESYRKYVTLTGHEPV